MRTDGRMAGGRDKFFCSSFFSIAGEKQIRRKHRQRRRAHEIGTASKKLPPRFVTDVVLEKRMRSEFGKFVHNTNSKFLSLTPRFSGVKAGRAESKTV